MSQEQPESPQKIGEPYQVDTVTEPCYGCGVVQEMEIYAQDYSDNPAAVGPKGKCPVCGNDHAKNPPW